MIKTQLSKMKVRDLFLDTNGKVYIRMHKNRKTGKYNVIKLENGQDYNVSDHHYVRFSNSRALSGALSKFATKKLSK